ncbi:MAG: Aromatic-L-amino-acid decarboxylase [uncultured Acidimicrobiales bacterium]|uniref:Aromatic-L-amino-acid decarboxylase n=1 Tax=uncultured Acidimicrobiales bacterium TaxID=310071 RepID=A0A6J4HFP7_9ACTN|nr:MAG: Aromatic-L-amino-acid decarboxylase [uncultured Acidimicrobiales bacterium]
MHSYHPGLDDFAGEVVDFARRRMAADANELPLGHPRPPVELDAAAGVTITQKGLGASEALRLFREVLEPACLSVDHHRYLAFVPAAPSEVSILADLVVSACSIYAGSWLEGAGAVWAENQALRWLADLAGLPEEAGGVFVSGGTMGNLSALVAARATAASLTGRTQGWALVVGESAHSSIAAAAGVMGVELVTVPGERLTGERLAPVLAGAGDRAFAVVATAGSTNLGLVDDLASVAEVCRSQAVWLHVDGAYGGAALAAPSARHRFAGVEHADSFIVDPHKWLFAPFDACALLYRDPSLAKACHAQHADYLEVLYGAEWNPSDYAVHLSRRARGLPLWFSLAAYGAQAYADAVETCLRTARQAAELVRAAPHVELVLEPELSVVVLRRTGWRADDYRSWSLDLLRRGDGFAVPSAHEGEPILRLCIVNTRTTADDISVMLDSMR